MIIEVHELNMILFFCVDNRKDYYAALRSVSEEIRFSFFRAIFTLQNLEKKIKRPTLE
jgi:hypothetical protein